MVTIKGPILIKKGKELPKEIKSFIMSEGFLREKTDSKIEKPIIKDNKEPTIEAIDNMSFKEARAYGRTINVVDRSLKRLRFEIKKKLGYI